MVSKLAEWLAGRTSKTNSLQAGQTVYKQDKCWQNWRMVYKLDEYKQAEQLTIRPNSLQMAVQTG